MADLAVWQRTIVDEEGNVIPGAEIEVRREEDDSLATLYADRAGETPLANPLAADMSGFVRFFAQGDAYTITAVGAGSTRTWRFDPTGRLQEFDGVGQALLGLSGDVGYNTITVRIPSDFATLQEAIDHYSRLPMRQGSIIELLIESGHQPITGVSVSNGNYAHFMVSAEDSIVEVSDDWVGSSIDNGTDISTGHFICGSFAALPILNCLVNMKGLGGNGYYGSPSCTGRVNMGCGVTFAGQNGLSFRTGFCFAEETIWDDAYNVGILAQHLGQIAAQGASADRCNKSGQNASVRASRGSWINFVVGKARNSGASGCLAIRGNIVCQGADFSGAANWGIETQQGGDIRAREAKANNCGNDGVFVRNGGRLDFMNGEATGNSGYGLHVDEGGRVNAKSAVISNNGTYNVFIRDGGDVCLTQAQILGSGTGVRIEGGNATLRAATVEGASVSSLTIYSGGTAHALGASLQKTQGVDDSNDIRVLSGGIIWAQNATGGTNVTPNTLNNGGIIWKN